MTKTLTEQWLEETLPEGLYYIEGKGTHDIALIRNRYCPVLTSPYCEDDVFEPEFVPVEPIPSYDEYRELLDLNVYEKDRKKVMGLEDKIKRLQEQLKEANEIILKLGKWTYVASDGEPIRISKYIKKWGVK